MSTSFKILSLTHKGKNMTGLSLSFLGTHMFNRQLTEIKQQGQEKESLKDLQASNREPLKGQSNLTYSKLPTRYCPFSSTICLKIDVRVYFLNHTMEKLNETKQTDKQTGISTVASCSDSKHSKLYVVMRLSTGLPNTKKTFENLLQP